MTVLERHADLTDPRQERLKLLTHAPKWIRANGAAPVTEVAARSLKSRLEPVEQYLRLAAQSHEEDVEYVHQLRVWTRRPDAAIEIYRDLLPEA